MLRAKDFRGEAWQKMNGKWGTLALITLIYVAINAACSGLSMIGIGAIALLLITGPLTVGYSIVALTVIRCQDTKIEYLFSGFNNFVNTFVLALLNTIFIFLWSLLLVIPGIIKMYAYSMSYYIIADNPGMTPTEARKASIELMRGNKWRLFCLQFSFIGWIILCVITCGILTFWVYPYMRAAEAAFYESIRPVAPAPEEPVQPAEANAEPFTEVKEDSDKA